MDERRTRPPHLPSDMASHSRSHTTIASISMNTPPRESDDGAENAHTGNSNGFHDGPESDEDDGLQMAPPTKDYSYRPPLSRSQSMKSRKSVREEKYVRHGWAGQLDSYEVARELAYTFFMYYEDKRHDTAGNPPLDFKPETIVSEWRMRDRLKTVSAILAVCLNVGVDPPDVIRTNPCARLECWVDPIPPDGTNQGTTSSNANAAIGKNLQSQYENLSLRTRYKVILDPTTEELKRFTTSLRKSAHQERILFHYNGHGVPKPTASGEIWCFNRSYTQYIPIGLYELQDWVGAPGLWVWDCSAASGIIKGFLDAAQKHTQAQQDALKRDPGKVPSQPLIKWDDCIHLAACKENEVLPTNPELPADVFTSCLTTPIAMAVRFFILQNPLPSTSSVTPAQARSIPGKVSERRTPLGELNWIFTAITDTIAWNCLNKSLFKKLFRQDLMVAALFRNFLLAQRVMRMYHCTPQSYPAIADTFDHPLWRSWDLAVEMILAQLPKLLEQQKAYELVLETLPSGAAAPPQPELEYAHSDFFADQLSAFDVYLTSAPTNTVINGMPKPPEQLPIVLQVLLSQVHRLRALVLLSKFLDLGPWAVNLALSIGIFPYVLKLLQSQAAELKAPMVFIWARILAVDQSCQSDLLKDSGYNYFTTILQLNTGIPSGNIAEHRAMCAFVIAMFCRDFRPGKAAVLESTPEVIEICLKQLLDMENPLLRQFSLLCISNLWKDHSGWKAQGLSIQAHMRVCDRTHDPVPEVRAAMLDAMTSFVGVGDIEPGHIIEEERVAAIVMAMGMDGSIMVRKELAVFYSTFIKKYEKRFLVAAWEQLKEEHDKKLGKPVGERSALGISEVSSNEGSSYPWHTDSGYQSGGHLRSSSLHSSDTSSSARRRSTQMGGFYSDTTVYRTVWRQTLSMAADPHPEVAQLAQVIVDYTVNALLESVLGPHANKIMDAMMLHDLKTDPSIFTGPDVSRPKTRDTRPETPPSPSSSAISKPEGYFALSRTASVAAAMKNLVTWGRTTSAEATAPPSPTRGIRTSMNGERPGYKSKPLTPHDAAMLPPDALDNIAGPPHQPRAKIPAPPYFAPRDVSKPPGIPVTSQYFTWSSSYFREPQMVTAETSEPGSIIYNERLWRRNRNDKIIASTQPLKDQAGTKRWDVPHGYFGIGAAPVKMLFHQFENHLVTSDDRDSIAVWDWAKQTQLCRFSNSNPPGSRVTELRFINEDDQAMLMTGSSDGVIKIFKNYDDPKRIELATSWRALSDLIASDKGGAGLVFDWQQGQGRVLVAGDDRVIRVWQAGHELSNADIPARSGSCITSLTSDQVEGNIFVAGFGNGAVRAYDQRCPPTESLAIVWDRSERNHQSWVVGVHLQRGGSRELISAESSGAVRLWDLRMRGPVGGLDGKKQPRNLRSLSVHEHAPVFATGGADHTIRVYNTQLKQISSFEPYMSYMRFSNTPRHAPITATAFHPHQMILACGAVNDGHVNLFKCEAEEKKESVVEEWQ
nr:target of rapamycin complex 1 subunit mip1 [Quercus suber]